MPRFTFVTEDEGGLLDYTDVDCDDQEASRSHAKRVIRELEQEGYSEDKLTMTVEDAMGELLFSLPLVADR